MMAANSARSAQLGFGKARRIVEKSVLLHKPASGEELAQIDDFMTMLSGNISEVKKRLANAGGFNDGIDSIMPMAEDWHKAAMAYSEAGQRGCVRAAVATRPSSMMAIR